MSRAVENDLLTLLPNLSSTGVPVELVQLANSLLSQSRSKAGNLKQDEEIGRSFCCAHIACERLKTTLDLPDIQVRPPCSKKVYSKLFTYFNSILSQVKNGESRTNSAAATPNQTPLKRKRSQGNAGPAIPSRTPQAGRATKSNTTIPDSHKKAKKTTSTNRHNADSKPLDDGEEIPLSCPDELLPAWIMNAIRLACSALHFPKLAPHVFAAFSVTGRQLFRLQTAMFHNPVNQLVFPAHVTPGLIIVVLARILWDRRYKTLFEAHDRSGDEKPLIPPPVSLMKLVDELFQKSGDSQSTANIVVMASPLEMCPDESQRTKTEYLEVCSYLISHLTDHHWYDRDVFSNARTAVLDGSARAVDDSDSDSPSNTARPGRKRGSRRSRDDDDGLDQGALVPFARKNDETARRGGGEMLNYATDWLSEERAREYERWRAKMLRLIDVKLRA